MNTSSVETLLGKAASAEDAVQAVNFAQAALNAAQALRRLAEFNLLLATLASSSRAKINQTQEERP